MAKEQRTQLSSHDTKVQASWLKNASKSLGVTGLNTLKSFAPNLYEVTTSATKTSRDIVKDLRQGKVSVNTIHRNIKNNKYIKYADKALKTMGKQITTGNFNDPEAVDRAMMNSMGFDDLDSMFDDSGLSFGDDGADNNVNVDVNVSDNNAGMFALSEQVRTQTEMSIKTSQANLDAMIALNANTMMQTQKMSTEIISGLNAINQNLASIVEYNNSTMSKFITSSIAFYEKMGSKSEEENSNYNDSSKVTIDDVLRGNHGNINFSVYKDYVKSNFKEALKKTEIGEIASMLTDDMIEMAISNPMGLLTEGLMKWMVPKTLKKTIEGAEATFNAVVPKMLHQLADWGTTETGIKKFIGQTFGISIKRENTINKSAKIEKGAVPFDGITRHTINEIITKELSEQTAYLKAIAQKIRVKDVDKVRNQAEVFDFSTGNYTTVQNLQDELRKDIQGNLNFVFNSSDLGKQIKKRFVKSDDTDETKKEKEKFLEFLTLLDERNSGKYIDLGSQAHNNLVDQVTQATDEIRNEYKRMIQDLISDPEMKAIKDTYHSMVYELSRVRNERIKYYEDNPYEKHLYRMGNINSIDEFMGVKNGNVTGDGRANISTSSNSTSNSNNNTNNRQNTSVFTNISNSIASTASGIVSGLAAGSLPQAFENIKTTVKNQVDTAFNYVKRKVLNPIGEKIRNSFFGTVDENGVRNGGLFAGVLNSFSDATKTLKWHITGQEYTDSSGVRHEAKNESETVVGTFKSIGSTIKDSIKNKFSALTDENTGIIPTIKSTLNEGIAGWQEAIFGKTLTEDERKDLTASAVKNINERLPSSMVGAVGGSFAGAGLLGSLIGGPVGGAILGSAVGFASKSEKFQKFVFGETDDEGNTLHEGLISKKVQEYVKGNKKELIGSGVIGAATGAITGAGLLGTIVGGPVAGALLGVGTSVLKKSHMFNEFLFGDEARGQVGIIQSVKNIFGKYSKASDGQKNLNKKVLGMGALGAGAGAVTAAALGKLGVFGLALGPGGPIGGALLGLGVSMLAQKENFHKWLFGEKDENGEMKSAGLITQFGNMIKTSIFMPMKDSITNYLEDAAITIHYDILDNIRFGIQPILDKTLGLAKSIGDKVSDMFSTMATNIKEFFAPIVDVVDNFVVKPVRKLVSGVTNIVYKSVKFAVTAPFRLIGGIGTFLKNRVTDAIAAFKTAVVDNIITPVKKTVDDYIIDPIKKKVQGFFNKIFGGIRNVATNIAGAISYIGDKWYNVGKDPKKFKDHTGKKDPTYYEQKKAAKENRKVEEQNLAQRRRERQIRTKNSEIIRKATGGMYTEDTEENRQRARMNDKYKDYKFDRIEALDVKWKREKQERDARSTAGLNENGILNANLSQLDPESQQVSLLSRILNVLKGKGDSQGYTHNDENQNPDDQNNNQQSGDNSNQSENNTQNNQQQDTTDQNNNQQSTDDSQNNTNAESKSDFRKEIEHRQAEIAAAGGLFKFWGNKYKNTKIHRFSKNVEDDLRNNIGWYGRLFNNQNNNQNQNNGGRGFAKGTDNAEPGLALVGEGGTAELVEFRGGEKVYPSTHPKTQAYMSTVANATGTMGMDEDHIIDADIKKLDTQSQQVQILLRILAILKGKPGTDDAKDIEKVIKEERAQLTESTQDNTEISETSEEGGEPAKEKTRSEKFQEDINGVADRIREAGGLRAYTKNAIKGSMSRAWNRSALKHGIDTVTGVTRGIGNVAKGTTTATLGLGKYLLNKGKDNLNGVVKKGKKAGSFLGGLLFGKSGESEEENDEGSKKKKGLFSKITGSIGKLGRKFSAQDDLEENENTIIDEDSDENNKELKELEAINERREETQASIDEDRKTRMAEAIDKGVTAEERQQQMKEEKEASVLNAIRESTETQVTEQKGFTKLWSSIFSKKGLITGSLILAAPFIIKAIKKIKEGGLWNFISGGLKNIGSFLSEKVGPFFKEHVEPLLLEGLGKIGETIGNTISTLLPDWANNLLGIGSYSSEKDTVNPIASAIGYKTKSGRTQWGVLDEQGKWDNESGARLKLGTKVGVKGASILPGLKSTLGKNVAKKGWVKGTAKTAKQVLSKKGRKEISKNGSNALIKKGNQKFRKNISKLLHGGTASVADDVGVEVLDSVPVELVDDAASVATNQIDDSMLFFGETAEDYLRATGQKSLSSGVETTERLLLGTGDDIGAATVNVVDDAGKSLLATSSDDILKQVGKASANLGDDAAETFVDIAGVTFKDVGDDVGEAAVKKARKTVVGETIEKAGGALKDKVVKIVGNFADDVVKLIEKKIGKKLGETGLGKIVSKVTQCLSKHFSKISAKVSAIFGAEAGLAATGVGLLAKDAVFCTLTAINGISGTARLFQVDKEDTDWVMTTISGALGFFNGTMVGSICDVVNELVVSVMGIDFYTSIASIVYKAIMALTGNKDKAEALDISQGEFKDKYESYINEESQASLDTAKQLGLVDSNMTLDEYKATYTKEGSDYKSFADYNDEQHKTIGSRMMGGLSKAGHAIVSPFMNQETITVTDQNGNTYVKNKDGTYTAKDSNGKEIGTVSGSLVESLENTTTDTSTKLGIFGKVVNTKPLRAIGNFNVKVGRGVGHFFAGHEEDAFQASDGTYYTTDGKHYNQLGYALGDSVSPDELQQMFNNGYVTGPVKFKVASGYTNMGASIGRGIANFGNNIVSGTKTVVNGMKQGFSNFATGVGKAATTIKDKAIYYANPLNVLADIIRGGRKTIEKLKEDWGKFTDKLDKLKNSYSSFFNELLPEFLDNAKTKLSDLGNKYSSFFTEIVPEFMNNAKEKVSTFFDKLGNNFSDLGNKYSSFFTEIVPDMITTMKTKFTNMKGSIDKKVDDLGKSILNAVNDLKDKIKNKITGAVDGVKEKAHNVKEGVKKWWNDGKENLYNAIHGNGVGLHGGRGPELAFATAIGSTPISNVVKKNINAITSSIQSKDISSLLKSSGKSKNTTKGYIAADNSYYDSEGNHYNAHGDILNGKLSSEELDAQITSGLLKEVELPFTNNDDDINIKQGSTNILKKFTSVFNTIQNNTTHIFNNMRENVTEIFENIQSASDVNDWKPSSSKVYYDPQGNYYILTGGNKFNYCNTMGDILGTATKTEVFNKLKASILKEYTKPNNGGSVANDIKSMKKAVSNAWRAAKNSGTSKWSAITKLLKGGKGAKSAIRMGNALSGYSFTNADAGDTGMYDALTSFKEYTSTYRKTLNEGDYSSNSNSSNKMTSTRILSSLKNTGISNETKDDNTANNDTTTISNDVSNDSSKSTSGGSGQIISGINNEHRFITPRLTKKKKKINKSRKMMNGGSGVGIRRISGGGYTEERIPIRTYKGSRTVKLAFTPSNSFQGYVNGKNYPSNLIQTADKKIYDLAHERKQVIKNGYKSDDVKVFNEKVKKYEKWEEEQKNQYIFKGTWNNTTHTVDYDNNAILTLSVHEDTFPEDSDGYKKFKEYYKKMQDAKAKGDTAERNKYADLINKLKNKYDDDGNLKEDESDDDDDDDITSSSSSSSSSSGGKKSSSSSGVSGSIFDILGSFFGEYASRASEGIFTGEFNKDWSSFWGTGNSDDGSSDDESESSSDGSSLNIDGIDDLNIVQNFTTNNGYYNESDTIKVKGLVLHSVGCAQPSADVWQANFNSRNDASVQAIIDAEKDNYVVQCTPWEMHCHHVCEPGNSSYIGVEMGESSSTPYSNCTIQKMSGDVKETVLKDIKRAYITAVKLFAALCRKFNLDPMGTNVIVSHCEVTTRGLSDTTHKDPEHYWDAAGGQYTMDKFRSDVDKLLKKISKSNSSSDKKSDDDSNKDDGGDGNGRHSIISKSNLFRYFGGRGEIDIDDSIQKTIKEANENYEKNKEKITNNIIKHGPDLIKRFQKEDKMAKIKGGHGLPYYTQNDSRWSKNAYGNDGATMGDTGCGPTAMAMVTSGLTGKKIKPTDMASLATRTGMRDETGTNSRFIDVAAKTYGLKSNESSIPDSSSLYNSAKNGPTVLLGQNESGTKNPFTNAGHYVVTDGIDSNGNIKIKDPRGNGYNKSYNATDLANTTSSMWNFGGNGKGRKHGGFGRRLLSKISRGISGFGKGRKKISGGRGPKKWMSIVKNVKKQLASKATGYKTPANVDVTIDGKTVDAMPDCSGYVCTCLIFYGVDMTTGSRGSMSPSVLEKNSGFDFEGKSGFKYKDFTGWDACTEGDIVGNSGHCEIFSHMEGNQPYVYNCGYTEAVLAPDPVQTSVTPGYTYIWSPGKAGSDSVNGDTDDENTNSTYDDDDDTTLVDSGTSWRDLSAFERINAWTSELAARVSEGALTGEYNEDWDYFWDNLNRSYTEEDSNNDNDDSSTTSSSSNNDNINGSDRYEKFWNFFTKNLGISKIGTSGFMGCYQGENEINPEHLECDFTSRATGTYADLTQKVRDALTNKDADNLPTLYDEYMNKVVIPSYTTVSLNLAAYKGKNGHYYPGMGFGSWTPSDDYIQYMWDNNLKWNSMEGSLKFWKYLYLDKYASQFKDKVDMISNADSPESAAAMVMDNILMPGSTWSTSNSGNMAKRAGFAREFYDKYGGSGKGRRRKKIGGSGVPYYAQTDKKWADNAYGNDGATMGDTGCGPTAMAMVTSSLTGEEVNPTEMASLANATGMRDETGTNANFINVAANTYGLSSNESSIPDSSTLYESAKNGPTVLLGQNESGTNNPFTDAGHYVVTDGVDSHGMINIKDPRGKGYNKKYKASDLANTTSSMWDFGGSGKNKKTENNISKAKLNNRKNTKRKGGRGLNKDRVKWLSIVRTVKKMMADKKLSYDQGGWTELTIDGVTNKVRQDCTGLIGGCLCFYDVLPQNSSVWTGIMLGPDSEMAKTGFKCKKFTSWKDLEPGDIVVNDVHGEIFSRMDGDNAYVYNAGTDDAIRRAGDEIDNGTYSWVWQPQNPGKNCVKANEDGSYSSMGNDSDSSDSTSSFKNKTLGKITSWLSEFANRSIEGIIGGNFNNDWESFWANLGTDSDDSGDDSDSDNTTLDGSDNETKIWNYFKKKGLSDAQVAGIMGNMQLESGFDPEAVNSSSGAYGIAQWLGSRKTALESFAKEKGTKSSDLQTQLDYYWHELETSESATYTALKQSKTAEEAATVIQDKFERCGDGTSQRQQFTKDIYSKYHKSGGSGNGRINNKNINTVKGGSGKVNNSTKIEERMFTNLENPHGTGYTGGNEKPSVIEVKKYEKTRRNAEKKLRGGHGDAIVDNVDILKKPKPPQVNNINRITNIKNKNNSDMGNVMNTIVTLLESIAGNTNTTAEKLDYLRSTVRDVKINGNTTTNVINQGSSSTISSSISGGSGSGSKSRNRILAEKIARGV